MEPAQREEVHQVQRPMEVVLVEQAQMEAMEPMDTEEALAQADTIV